MLEKLFRIILIIGGIILSVAIAGWLLDTFF